ncbi:hypothetical protein RAS1_20100 [Phycisphaerae bacterium RAS1]|nr:hypothetical protein RAS1_20100 [Phycisphaerae bacterium RAS1]
MRSALLLIILCPSGAAAQAVAYECEALPEIAGWQIVQIWCDPKLWLDQGRFFQHVELCPGYPPPGGQQAAYRRSLDAFLGVPTFFFEFRVQTDADRSELPWGGGCVISAGGTGAAAYICEMARDKAEFWRSNLLPVIEVDIAPDVPHTYRVELYGTESYIWYIDGQLQDSGAPQGPYPSSSPTMVWRAKAAWQANTTQWDYIRYGLIPADASGDYDSDGDVDEGDLYFFSECLLGEGVPSGPGCRFADFDVDGDTDCDDWAAFAAHWTGPPAVPPMPPACAAVGDTNCDGAVNVLDINPFVMALSDPSVYAAKFPNCPIATADANGDGEVDILDINALVAILSGR